MAVRFFDGETAIGHAATVLIESSGLLIRIPGGGEDQFWAFWTLHWKDGPDGNEVVLSAHGAGTARLVIDDPELLAELAQRMGRRWKPGGRTRRPLAFTAALACASLLAGWIIMVRLPEWVAPLVPLAWQDRLAEAAAVALSSHRVCSGTEGQAAIDALETKLVQAARIPGEVTITVVDDPDVNAFALPGNRIVVLRGLIDTAKDGDELAGILAHESAHLAHLDPVVGVIRNVGLSAIAHSLGMGGALAPKLGTRMLSLAYSRSVEARADRSAAAYLHAAGLRADGLARFFTRLQQLQGSDILPAFLSDHPPLAQRKTKMADDAAGVAALSPREWAAIRSMCGR